MITRRAPRRGDTAARRRERLIGELESSVQGFAEAERPIGANGQPMRTLAEIEAMSDEDLLAFVLSQVPEHARVGPVFENESAAGCD